VLIILLIAMLPTWPYSTGWGWGYYPSGGLALLLLIVIVVLLMRRGPP
jgi:hypothetical protein